MAIDPKGRYFATGSTDTLIGLWDLEEFTMLKTFSQSDYAIQELSFSYDGALLAAIFNDKNVAIHNTQTGKFCPKIFIFNGFFWKNYVAKLLISTYFQPQE